MSHCVLTLLVKPKNSILVLMKYLPHTTEIDFAFINSKWLLRQCNVQGLIVIKSHGVFPPRVTRFFKHKQRR